MLRSRIRLACCALALVAATVTMSAPSSATAEPKPFGRCPNICELVDCYDSEEGWCLGHCNELCEVCN
jgi:hypothetical protein